MYKTTYKTKIFIIASSPRDIPLLLYNPSTPNHCGYCDITSFLYIFLQRILFYFFYYYYFHYFIVPIHYNEIVDRNSILPVPYSV